MGYWINKITLGFVTIIFLAFVFNYNESRDVIFGAWMINYLEDRPELKKAVLKATIDTVYDCPDIEKYLTWDEK